MANEVPWRVLGRARCRVPRFRLYRCRSTPHMRSQVEGAQRQAQQYHALDQRNGRCDRRPELSKPVRVLESHGPADFEKPCQEQNGPRNVIASAGRVPCTSIQTIVSKGESLGKTNTRGSDQEPHRGCVNCGHHRFEIVDMDGNRVDRVLAMRVRKRTRCALSRSFPLVWWTP